jgi:hypothetical protein
MAGDDSNLAPPASAGTLREAIIRLLHPIPLTVLVMLIGVTLLIAANVMGWDNGNVLTQMSTHEFARGLITYLFAVTTIGTAVVLVMAALMREISEEAYTRGKEILALLLGVFGTIVGFYFGSEAGGTQAANPVSITQPLVSASVVPAGTTVQFTAWVSGGTPPYRYAIGAAEPSSLTPDRVVPDSGWIVHDYAAPQVATDTDLSVAIRVVDGSGGTTSTRSSLRVTPAAPASPAPARTP